MSVKFLCPSVLVLTALTFCPARGQELPDAPGVPEVGSSLPSPTPPAPAEGAEQVPLPRPTADPLAPNGAAPSGVVNAPPLPEWSPWHPQTPSQWGAASVGATTAVPPPTPQPPTGGPSDYIPYFRPLSCYCPIGGNGPIQMELYLRNGVSATYGNSVATRGIDPGYTIQGGVRSDFFDPTMTSAWVVDLGLMNTFNHYSSPEGFSASMLVPLPITAISPGGTMTISVPGVPTPQSTTGQRVTFGATNTNVFGTTTLPALHLHSINRTWVNFGLGKMWYLTGAANSPGTRWRWGIDGGGRYGTWRYEFYETRHRSSILGTGYGALYTDLEIPCGCCSLVGGFRVEYAYTHATILHEVNADMQDFNLMFNAGVRY